MDMFGVVDVEICNIKKYYKLCYKLHVCKSESQVNNIMTLHRPTLNLCRCSDIK